MKIPKCVQQQLVRAFKISKVVESVSAIYIDRPKVNGANVPVFAANQIKSNNSMEILKKQTRTHEKHRIRKLFIELPLEYEEKAKVPSKNIQIFIEILENQWPLER